MGFLLVCACLLWALVTFLNGFHDASNAVATSVRTRALTPGIATIVVAGFAAAGTFLSTGLGIAFQDQFELALAPGPAGLVMAMAALASAAMWALFTWWRGQPTSQTHGMYGGLVGALVAAITMGHMENTGVWLTLLLAILIPLAVTVLVAPLLSILIMIPAAWLMRYQTPKSADRIGRVSQAIATAAVAFAHGLQDGQRLAVFLLVMTATAGLGFDYGDMHGFEIITAMILGAGMLVGGWRITYTLSTRLVQLDPLRAGMAKVSSSLLVFFGSIAFHLPISSTQSVTTSLLGAGLTQRHMTVNQRRAVEVAAYWLMTPVVTFLVSAVLYLAASPLIG
ncbi:inorganic phosphate transporter [Pseudoglutamicibacter albus]|uniref:PiT family inorganic phosphate transporter n=1 Tax=Pseudoglutamicibacter albus TaxID=98671 RepID=A0ABU1Z1Y4_9MICC|nr:inorganic phosphate transporter [Pseudoglutamicibacter albus]MDR7294632.1 PiT family inorganic phosphate transporter [Pseudoglutamicibacter albus]